jgi:hypothetical protein
MMNGTAIDPAKTYKGVTIKFLLDGGSSFSSVIGTSYTPRNVVNLGEFRSCLKPILQGMGIIRAGTLMDPANPRIIINRV